MLSGILVIGASRSGTNMFANQLIQYLYRAFADSNNKNIRQRES